MLRRVIEIEEEKCNGCGACANACHEGAISIVNGKAKLMRVILWSVRRRLMMLRQLRRIRERKQRSRR